MASEDQGQVLHVPSCPKANSHFRAKRKEKKSQPLGTRLQIDPENGLGKQSSASLLRNKNKSTDFPLRDVLAHVFAKHPTLRLNRALSDIEESVWCGPNSPSQFSLPSLRFAFCFVLCAIDDLEGQALAFLS